MKDMETSLTLPVRVIQPCLLKNRERSLRKSPKNKSWFRANIYTGRMIFIIQPIFVLGQADLGTGEEIFATSKLTRETNASQRFFRQPLSLAVRWWFTISRRTFTFSGLMRFSVNRYMPVLLSPSLRYYMSSSFNECSTWRT